MKASGSASQAAPPIMHVNDRSRVADPEALYPQTGCECVHPASFKQEALWALDQLHGFTPALANVCAVPVSGPVDTAKIASALRHAVRTLPILRTVLVQDEVNARKLDSGKSEAAVVQVQLRDCDVSLETLYIPEPVDVDPVLDEQRSRPFELSHGPLLRACAINPNSSQPWLVLSAHAAVLDIHSLEQLLTAIATENGVASALCSDSFADLARAERASLSRRSLEEQLAQLKSRLERATFCLQLPADQRPENAEGYAQRTIDFELAKLPGGAAPEAYILAALQVLLYRYSGATSFALAVASDLRADRTGIFGPLLNDQPVFVEIAEDTSLAKVLRTATDSLASLGNAGDIPFETLQAKLFPNTVRSATTPFSVRVEFAQFPANHRIQSTTPRCDWNLRFDTRSNIVCGCITYNSKRFHPETLTRFIEHLQNVLLAFQATLDQPAHSLDFLGPAEKTALVRDHNRTQAPYPRSLGLQQLVEQQASVTPDAVAVEFQNSRITYAQLNRAADHLANLLQARGVQPGTLVALCVDRSLPMVEALLGILKAGGAYIPIDPDYPAQRIEYMLEDSRAPFILTQAHVRDRLPRSSAQLLVFEELLQATDSGAFVPPPADPERPLYVLYTSGSTGKPKGVAVPHRAVVNVLHCLKQLLSIGGADVLLATTTLCFDISVLEMFLPLISGARIVIASRALALDPVGLSRALVQSGATFFQATPTMWRMLTEAGLPTGLRLTAISGGEPLERSLANRILDSATNLWDIYGPTETTIYSVGNQVLRQPGPVLIGTPLANTSCYVLDGNRQLVPDGVAGELYIGGEGVALGYLNRPELTAQRFLPDPFSETADARMYRTGDLVRRQATGSLEYLGRCDNQVKIRGFRIELGEIESVLKLHPEVKDAVASAREDSAGSKRLVAYIVPKASKPDPSVLRALVREKLPEYMVPAAFVFIESIPLTPNRKIDRNALPAPDLQLQSATSSYAAPQTQVQLALQKIWEKILGIHPIGIHDNYFDLGAESLQAARVFAAISKTLGKQLPPTTLFKAPTIQLLAEVLTEGEPESAWTSLVPIQTQGSRPPLFFIHGGAGTILFLYDLVRHLGSDHPVYALQNQGLYGGAPPETKVEQMADHYLREIRSIQATGPYHLFGYCFGSLVAFEIAQMLRAQGEEVAFLASLNGPAPRYGSGFGARRRLMQHRTFSEKLVAHRTRMLELSLLGRCRYAIGALQSALTWRVRMRIVQQRWNYYTRRKRALPPDLRDTYFLISNTRAEYAYLPQSYPGALNIYRARGLYRDAHLGWDEFVSGPLESREVPGAHRTHRDMMDEPIVADLAELLRADLNACAERRSVAPQVH